MYVIAIVIDSHCNSHYPHQVEAEFRVSASKIENVQWLSEHTILFYISQECGTGTFNNSVSVIDVRSGVIKTLRSAERERWCVSAKSSPSLLPCGPCCPTDLQALADLYPRLTCRPLLTCRPCCCASPLSHSPYRPGPSARLWPIAPPEPWQVHPLGTAGLGAAG